MNDLHKKCKYAALLARRIKYKGTNADEYDKENFGKQLCGEGTAVAYSDSHGLCIRIINLDENLKTKEDFWIEPTEIEILN